MISFVSHSGNNITELENRFLMPGGREGEKGWVQLGVTEGIPMAMVLFTIVITVAVPQATLRIKLQRATHTQTRG